MTFILFMHILHNSLFPYHEIVLFRVAVKYGQFFSNILKAVLYQVIMALGNNIVLEAALVKLIKLLIYCFSNFSLSNNVANYCILNKYD